MNRCITDRRPFAAWLRLALGASLGVATAMLPGGALSAQAAAGRATRPAAGASPSRYAIVPSLGAMSPAREAAEEGRARRRADAMRERVLVASRWAPLGEDGCDTGALRTFAEEVSAAANARADSAQASVEALEYLVIARGVGEPLDTPAGRALVTTLVAWESGVAAPRWDVAAGQAPRSAISAGLTGRARNPVTNVCGPALPLDTARFVLPTVTGIAVPRGGPVPVVLYTRAADVNAARTRVLAGRAVQGADFPTFNYVRVRTVALWGDYAVISVARDGDRAPGSPPAPTAGGATYIFHRTGGEWRLLAVPRTWA